MSVKQTTNRTQLGEDDEIVSVPYANDLEQTIQECLNDATYCSLDEQRLVWASPSEKTTKYVLDSDQALADLFITTRADDQDCTELTVYPTHNKYIIDPAANQSVERQVNVRCEDAVNELDQYLKIKYADDTLVEPVTERFGVRRDESIGRTNEPWVVVNLRTNESPNGSILRDLNVTPGLASRGRARQRAHNCQRVFDQSWNRTGYITKDAEYPMILTQYPGIDETVKSGLERNGLHSALALARTHRSHPSLWRSAVADYLETDDEFALDRAMNDLADDVLVTGKSDEHNTTQSSSLEM